MEILQLSISLTETFGNSGRPTCDLDVHGSLVMPRHVLRLHRDLVNAWASIAMLDGLIRHRQVLIDGPHPVPEVHLVFGATGVALVGGNSDGQQVPSDGRLEKGMWKR